jgi:hypothetical protein
LATSRVGFAVYSDGVGADVYIEKVITCVVCISLKYLFPMIAKNSHTGSLDVVHCLLVSKVRFPTLHHSNLVDLTLSAARCHRLHSIRCMNKGMAVLRDKTGIKAIDSTETSCRNEENWVV